MESMRPVLLDEFPRVPPGLELGAYLDRHIFLWTGVAAARQASWFEQFEA
jgi:hypothetical protein